MRDPDDDTPAAIAMIAALTLALIGWTLGTAFAILLDPAPPAYIPMPQPDVSFP